MGLEGGELYGGDGSGQALGMNASVRPKMLTQPTPILPQDISTVLALCRAGFGQQAVGAGVLQMIGHNEDRSWAVGSVANAGQTYSVGSGILQMHGGQIMNFQVSLLQVVNGGSGFVGSGDLGYIGMTYGTFGVSFSQHGLGMRWSSNAGLLENILISGVSTAVVRVQYILGSESYLGSTWARVLG